MFNNVTQCLDLGPGVGVGTGKGIGIGVGVNSVETGNKKHSLILSNVFNGMTHTNEGKEDKA